MPQNDIYLYSPLSIKTVTEGHNRALLLQFILSELFHVMRADRKEDPLEFVFSSPACFFPYDWSYDVGCLNKMGEHADLLEFAFPDLQEYLDDFNDCLDDILDKVVESKEQEESLPHTELLADLKQLFRSLEPFLIATGQSENLLLFLLKNKDKIDVLTLPGGLTNLLKKMHPLGLDIMGNHMHREFKKRGFHTILPEIDRMLSHHER